MQLRTDTASPSTSNFQPKRLMSHEYAICRTDTCDIDDHGAQAIIGLPVVLRHIDVQPLSRLLAIVHTPDHTRGQEVEEEHLHCHMAI